MMNQSSLIGRTASLVRTNPRALAAGLLLLVAVPLGITSFGPGSHLLDGRSGNGDTGGRIESAVDAAKRAGVSFLSMLDQRSPGARTAGELADTKAHARALPARTVRPHQRALAKVRQPTLLPDSFVQPLIGAKPVVSAAPPLGLIEAAPEIASAAPLVPGLFALPPVIGGVVGPGGVGGGGGGGVGGGGGGGGIVPTVTQPVVTPTPAVPEPGSWGLMLIGFGATGFAMRRRQRSAVRLSPRREVRRTVVRSAAA